MNKPMRIARHVYLRTQQRRLRHVKGILIRNLTLPHTYLTDPLNISVYFTIHPQINPEKVLFKSDPIQDSYNPSWDSIQLTSHGVGHYQSFLLRVWVKCMDEDVNGEEGYSVAFERKVELFDLSYLGLMVNKDGSGYPPNSVAVSMYEGLYSHPEVGGVPCAPIVVHTLTDYLPPQSLLEVPKKEVVDSYLQSALNRILKHQEMLNSTRRQSRLERAKVEHYLQVEREAVEKKNERERLITRLKLYEAQLKEREEPDSEESGQLERVTREVDEADRDLRERQADLSRKMENLHSAMSVFTHKKEQMQRLKRNRHLRQRHMVYELSSTFLIKDREDTFTICNVILPNADQLEQPTRVEQLGVALGYVAHLIHHLGKILFLPLLYPIRPQGSKSIILDLVSEETLIDNIKEFPLFAKGSEKALFQYAVFLLNKDIAQIRQHCGYGTSKTMFKRTLPNLKFLLDRLTRDVKEKTRGNNHSAGFHAHPHDPNTSITSSYVSVDTASVASGSVAGSFPSPEADSLRSFSSSVFPSRFTQTQQFVQHDGNLSRESISPAKPSSQDNHTPVLHSDIDHPLSPDQLHAKCPTDDEIDASGRETDVVSLADMTTEHTFTQPLGSVERVHLSGDFFQVTQPSGDEEEEEDDDEEEDEEEGGSTTSSVPSLSTTPLVPEGVCDPATAMNLESSSSLTTLLSTEEVRETLPDDSVSTLKLSSSAVSHSGHLEDTLKAAVHVTQLLMGHTPPEHIQIEPVPTIFGTNEAEIETTQALRGLNAASFAGQAVLGTQSLDIAPEAPENSEQGNEEDAQVPQGPPTFPDSLQLLSSRTAGQSSSGGVATGDHQTLGTSPEWRPGSMARSAITLENVGYVKTGMATPHRVGRGSTRNREERETRFASSGGLPGNRGVENGGQSLADFIDDTGSGTQNRLKQWSPHLLRPHRPS